MFWWKSENDMLITWNKRAPHSSHHHCLLQRVLGQRFQAARVKNEVTATGRPTARDHRGCPARNSFRHRTRSEKVSRVGSRRLSSTSWTRINFSCWSIAACNTDCLTYLQSSISSLYFVLSRYALLLLTGHQTFQAKFFCFPNWKCKIQTVDFNIYFRASQKMGFNCYL